MAMSSASRRPSTRPRRRIASCPSAGRLPCAAFPATSTVTHANPLCPTAIARIGRLGDDGAVGGPALDERVGADARMLFVDDGGDHEAAGRESLLRDRAGRGNHRGDAALHVLRAAAVQPAIALRRRERIAHAGDADGIGVAAEHERASLRPSLEDADDIGPAGCHGLDRHVEPEAAHRGGDRGGDLLFARRARHERRVHGVDGDEIAEQTQSRIHDHRVTLWPSKAFKSRRATKLDLYARKL